MKKKNKYLLLKILTICLIVTFSISMQFIAYAHSGGTDSDGGHYDHSTGEYHYHHGYPAHQHVNGECPYDFDDQTNHSSGGSSSSKAMTSISGASDANDSDSSDELILLILVGLMLGGPVISSFTAMIVDGIKSKKKKYQASPAISENVEENKTPKNDVAIATKVPKANVKLCPRCGNYLVIRNGRYGKFYGCDSFPYCKYTESIKKR